MATKLYDAPNAARARLRVEQLLAAGLSQREIAARAGIAQSMVSRLLAGRPSSRTTVDRILAVR